MHTPDDRVGPLLLELERLRHLDEPGIETIETATQLLRAGHDAVTEAQAHMALARAHANANGDPAAAMHSASRAINRALVARSEDPDNTGLVVAASTLSAELLRRYGQTDQAAALLASAVPFSGSDPVMQGHVRLVRGRLHLGDFGSVLDFENQVATYFEAAAEQLMAGPDDILYAWALVHDCFGMFCTSQPSLAAMALNSLEALIRHGLVHLGINQAHACLAALLSENNQYRVAIRTTRLLHILRI